MGSAPVNSCDSISFSEYYSTLTGPTKIRYREKVYICGFDPYALKKSGFQRGCSRLSKYYISRYCKLPGHQTSWKTGQEKKAWKPIDAYNFFISGWVNNILTKDVEGTGKVVVIAQVNHSQRSRETPLKT